MVSFAELKADLPGRVRAIADWLGIELTDDQLAKVIDKPVGRLKARSRRRSGGADDRSTGSVGSVGRVAEVGGSPATLLGEPCR